MVLMKSMVDVSWEVEKLGGQQLVWRESKGKFVLGTEVYWKPSLMESDVLVDCPDLEVSGSRFENNPPLKFTGEEKIDTELEKKEREEKKDFPCRFCKTLLANRRSLIKHERDNCRAAGSPNHKCYSQVCEEGCLGSVAYNQPPEKIRGRKAKY